MVRGPITCNVGLYADVCVCVCVCRFLLKYTSRDAVQVLTQGTGGAGEVRAAVAQYEENSPLYGFMLYRRRKVLVKYVPEGTSRLLQGISTHFTFCLSVC
jgi:hypothetical protein